MLSTISIIQANLQHSFADSGIFSRTMGVNGIDMALVQEPCYRDDYITDLNISGYTPYSTGEKENLEPVTLRGK